MGPAGNSSPGDWYSRGRMRVGPAQNCSEWMGRNDKAPYGSHGLAQDVCFVEAGLVLVYAEGQHVAHVRLNFGGPHQHHVMPGGESLKFMAVPGPAVFGDAEAPQSQPVGLQNEVLRGKGCCRCFPWWCEYVSQKAGPIQSLPSGRLSLIPAVIAVNGEESALLIPAVISPPEPGRGTGPWEGPRPWIRSGQ